MTNTVSHDFHVVRRISFNIIDFCCIYCSLYIDLHVSHLKTRKQNNNNKKHPSESTLAP